MSKRFTNQDIEDLPPDEELPSYEDVIRQEEAQNRPQYAPPARPPSTPARPPRPSNANNYRHSYGPTAATQPSSSHLKPPPRPGVNTAASASSASVSSGRPRLSPSSSSLSAPPKPYSSQNTSLPWTYPRGFYCPKCNNTGYKLKNGKSCKSCWRRFAPANRVDVVSPTIPTTTYGYNPFPVYQAYPTYRTYSTAPFVPAPQPVGYTIPVGGGAGAGVGNTRPLVVKPGDPRLGGVVCGNCRGTGRVRFLLDEDICPLCNGIGRLVNMR